RCAAAARAHGAAWRIPAPPTPPPDRTAPGEAEDTPTPPTGSGAGSPGTAEQPRIERSQRTVEDPRRRRSAADGRCGQRGSTPELRGVGGQRTSRHPHRRHRITTVPRLLPARATTGTNRGQ